MACFATRPSTRHSAGTAGAAGEDSRRGGAHFAGAARSCHALDRSRQGQGDGLVAAHLQRIWAAHGLQPHRIRTSKRSTDRRQDVVGLYMNPPRHAVVVSIDEKSHPGARRTQPGLPMKRASARPSRTTTSAIEPRPYLLPLACSKARSSSDKSEKPLHFSPSTPGRHRLHHARRANPRPSNHERHDAGDFATRAQDKLAPAS